MTNILEAIINIVEYGNYKLKIPMVQKNRMNNLGVALEYFIKDSFSNTFSVDDEVQRDEIYRNNFSWLGNQNNPPDAMIWHGDAIEVKKSESATASLPLNSSYPKATIKSDSTLLAPDFKTCEGDDWKERDIIYALGHAKNFELQSLWFVYGNIYAARHETYNRIIDTISDGINTIPDIEFAETKELGGVKRVDPLGITDLRIRGMWQIQNPRRVFSYLMSKSDKNFELVAIIPNSKYESFPKESRYKIEKFDKPNFTIKDVEVKNPNNPAQMIKAKLIIYRKTK
jgi:hypothetical protein